MTLKVFCGTLLLIVFTNLYGLNASFYNSLEPHHRVKRRFVTFRQLHPLSKRTPPEYYDGPRPRDPFQWTPVLKEKQYFDPHQLYRRSAVPLETKQEYPGRVGFRTFGDWHKKTSDKQDQSKTENSSRPRRADKDSSSTRK